MGEAIMDITSYILAKKYVDAALSGAGALKGDSAYDIAIKNGFNSLEYFSETFKHIMGVSPRTYKKFIQINFIFTFALF